MIKGLWIARKNELCSLIRQTSTIYGGDDAEWLRDYAKESIQVNKDCIDKAISCFRSLCSESDKNSLKSQIKAYRTNVCADCGYVAPFCYYYLTKECSNVTKNEQKGVLRGTLSVELMGRS